MCWPVMNCTINIAIIDSKSQIDYNTLIYATVCNIFILINVKGFMSTTLPNSSLIKVFKITVARLHPLLKIVQISSRKLNISQ